MPGIIEAFLPKPAPGLFINDFKSVSVGIIVDAGPAHASSKWGVGWLIRYKPVTRPEANKLANFWNGGRKRRKHENQIIDAGGKCGLRVLSVPAQTQQVNISNSHKDR